jgi:hypothetical protein
LSIGVAAMRFGEQCVHIQVTDFAAVNLIERDLQRALDKIVSKAKQVVSTIQKAPLSDPCRIHG